jgi:hypothetical protein
MARNTFMDLDVEGLRAMVIKLKRKVRRQEATIKYLKQGQEFNGESIRGGSLIRVRHALDDKFNPIPGMAHLEVGETCIYTVNQDISIQGLACLLTYCRDIGFEKVLSDYLVSPGAMGSADSRIDKDTNSPEKEPPT